MGTYLEDHPPARAQYRRPRRAQPSGAIVAHTAENMLDTVGPDTGAENVARFIRGRSDAGSYHTIVDSDSVVRLVPFDAEAFGARTGNSWALHLSFACRAADWPTMAPAQRVAMIANGAQAAAEMARWCRDVHGITVPAAIINDAQYRLGVPGLISHAAVDPGRRSDPGRGFPWAEFIAAFNREMETPTMTPNPYTAEVNEALQLLAEHAGYVGTIDGWFGPQALAALHRLKNASVQYRYLSGELDAARADLDDLRRRPSSELVDALAEHVRHMATLLEDRP